MLNESIDKIKTDEGRNSNETKQKDPYYFTFFNEKNEDQKTEEGPKTNVSNEQAARPKSRTFNKPIQLRKNQNKTELQSMTNKARCDSIENSDY